ncbi:MAG: SH3 domain-containing protein [Desulfobaccales bacterium]
MKPVAANRWLLIAIPVLAVAFGLAGCAQPRYIPPPLPGGPPAPAPPPQVSRQVLYVKVRNLNLRACPGMDCPKISVLEQNEEVEKVGASEDWFQIRVKRDGRLGWVDSRYLSPTPMAAPEAAPPPPLETAPPPPPERMQPPPLPERMQQPPLQERPAPPVEKFKPAPPEEEEVPPAPPQPQAKPAKPAKAKPPEETGETAPKAPPKAAPQEQKPAPQEQKPAPAPGETPAPGQNIRIM